MKVRSPYNYDVRAASSRCALSCDPKEGKTQQQFKEECDINTIARRFGLTGQLPQGVRVPEYGDFTGVYDYQSAIEAIRQADQSFMAMSAQVRERFANDPQQFLMFCADPGNLDEMRTLGLAVPLPAPPVPPAPPIQPEVK